MNSISPAEIEEIIQLLSIANRYIATAVACTDDPYYHIKLKQVTRINIVLASPNIPGG